MSIQFKRILPTPFEMLSMLLLTVGIVALGYTQNLLSYYDLNSSTEVIHNSAGAAISSGLSRIDSLNMTAQVVTFLIWSGVGLFCLSLIQMIGRVFRGLELDEQLSSNRYVHPTTFVRAVFWKHVVLNFIATVVCVGLLVGAVYLFLVFALPFGLANTRLFLYGITPSRLGALLLGLALLYVWMLVFCVLFKLLVHRRQVFVQS